MKSSKCRVLALGGASILIFGCPGGGGGGGGGGDITVIGYSELGMHCMNEDFSKLMILPPYNNLRAQVIRRGEEPQIVTGGGSRSPIRFPPTPIPRTRPTSGLT